MKYRRLYPDELAELEKQFIRFLAAQSIQGSDWEQLKRKAPEKAEQLIEQFSEVVFEKVLSDVQYLERKTPKDLKLFKCDADTIYMVGLLVEGDVDFDFTKNPKPDQMIQQVRQTGASLKVYRAQKAYQKERKQELFEMMENGCKIASGELYTILNQLTKK